ncbi:hypothetical protein [Stutzerimonas kunmingensis]|uniref:hypothetical protein n=1 Tax=Stutzerimonas kunmingensis TaxID=1211807 RepID=UPI0028B234DE|nr:hypothetical protein [Stutzerimonas kunmingensis]
MSAASLTAAARRQAQLAFLASGTEFRLGRAEDCPLPPAELAAVTGNEPWVRDCLDDGLTARVYRVQLDGRDWALKVARRPCRVQNPDGQTSFLNELQRRRDLARLMRTPEQAERLAGIVPTQYASLQQGIVLSPWVEGQRIERWDERQLVELFDLLIALLLAGLFEWDLAPGNTLDDGRIRLFDFGYLYPFDPLRHYNSDGLASPGFHPAERFETRQLFACLLRMEQESETWALANFELEKRIALDAYQRLHRELAARGASQGVLDWLSGLMRRWRKALAGDLGGLYLQEAWRSHWLDVKDDLSGQSCTPLTLQRLAWLRAKATAQHVDLLTSGALANERQPDREALLNDLRLAEAQAVGWQLGDMQSAEG